MSATIEKRKGRWGTTHWAIVGVPELEGDYQETGNAFDTLAQAWEFARLRGIIIPFSLNLNNYRTEDTTVVPEPSDHKTGQQD